MFKWHLFGCNTHIIYQSLDLFCFCRLKLITDVSVADEYVLIVKYCPANVHLRLTMQLFFLYIILDYFKVLNVLKCDGCVCY